MCVCVCVLVSTDKVLRFINTLIIIKLCRLVGLAAIFVDLTA